MAKKRRRAANDDDPGLDISSLIDVCFLLLIYFIVATSLIKEESELRQTIPTPSESTSDLVKSKLEIDIGSDGVIYLKAGGKKETLDSNKNSRELPILNRRVRLYASGSTQSDKMDLQVQIYINGEAKQQRFMDVLNVVKSYDIPTVGLAIASGN